MENALWHKVSEKEKEEIKKQAKHLMDEFSLKLEKIKTSETWFENDSGMRREGSGWETDKEFLDTIFCNAPDVEDNLFIGEKGGWK